MRVAPITSARKRSKASGQTTRFAIPVSSSSVTNTTPLALPRPLAHEHQAGDGDEPARLDRAKLDRAHHAFPREALAQQGQRVSFQRELEEGVVADDVLAKAHFRQPHGGLCALTLLRLPAARRAAFLRLEAL